MLLTFKYLEIACFAKDSDVKRWINEYWINGKLFGIRSTGDGTRTRLIIKLKLPAQRILGGFKNSSRTKFSWEGWYYSSEPGYDSR